MNIDLFFNHFHLTVATTPEQQAQAHHIRFCVYCEEYKFEESSRFTNQQEFDEYDHRAIQCLLIHRATNKAVGCIRLIQADSAEPTALFPVEQLFQTDSVFPFKGFARYPRFSMSELSRLAILAPFRKTLHATKAQEQQVLNSIRLSDTEEALRPLFSISLFYASLALLYRTGAVNNFAVMEPRLVRRLQHVGIYYRQIGAIVEHHGKRAPFQLDFEASARRMQDSQPQLFETIDHSIASAFSTLDAQHTLSVHTKSAVHEY